jgi:hypothetical protein
MTKTPKGITINLTDALAMRGRTVQPGDGQMSRGLDSAIQSEPGSLNENARLDRPPVRTLRQQTAVKSKRFWTGSGGATPDNLNGTDRGPTLERSVLDGNEPINDGPMPIARRQLPHPDLVNKAEEAAAASASIGNVPVGVLGG